MIKIKEKAKHMHCLNLFSKITVNKTNFFDNVKTAKIAIFANTGLELADIIPTAKPL